LTLIDANLLLYAYDADAPQHAAAAAWLQGIFRENEPLGLPWVTLWAFVRIATNARLWPNPKTVDEAFRVVRELVNQPGVVIVNPGARHRELLEKLIQDHRASGPLVSDAVLAALAIENGATLASSDQDFSRFTELRWINPLRGTPPPGTPKPTQ
jgi:uncharacterized protein